MSKSQKGSNNDLNKVETENKGGEEFIQVKKKSEKAVVDKKSGEDQNQTKKKNKSRSRNNSLGEGKPTKPRYLGVEYNTYIHI